MTENFDILLVQEKRHVSRWKWIDEVVRDQSTLFAALLAFLFSVTQLFRKSRPAMRRIPIYSNFIVGFIRLAFAQAGANARTIKAVSALEQSWFWSKNLFTDLTWTIARRSFDRFVERISVCFPILPAKTRTELPFQMRFRFECFTTPFAVEFSCYRIHPTDGRTKSQGGQYG